MKKIVSVVLIVSIISLLSLNGCSKDNGNELKIFNWGEYISDGTDGSPDILHEFEKETNIKIKAYDTFDSNEQMYAKLKSGGSDYDLIFPSDYMAARLINEKMVQKIDKTALLNYNQIDEQYLGSVCGYDTTDEYTVPYTWGTVGIVYNKSLVEKLTGQSADDVITSWSAFWNKDLDDNILMFINSRDSFGIAEKLMGYSLNTTDETEIYKSAQKLKEQKPLVQSYVMDEMFDKMIEGEAAVSPAYSGDIVTMLNQNSDLGYCFPKEGSNLFVDCVCIPKEAKNYQNALKFIDFLLRPDIAKANAEFINYSTPNKGAYALLSEQDKENAIAYPPSEIKSKCETFTDLPQATVNLMENYWIDIRK